MSATKTYDVHRSMHGDGKDFGRGDTRTMNPADAEALLQSGALSEKGEEPAKPESAVQHTFGSAPTTTSITPTPDKPSVDIVDKRAETKKPAGRA